MVERPSRKANDDSKLHGQQNRRKNHTGCFILFLFCTHNLFRQPLGPEELFKRSHEQARRSQDRITPRSGNGDPHVPPLGHSQRRHHLVLNRRAEPAAIRRKKGNASLVQNSRQLAERRAAHEQPVRLDHARQGVRGVVAHVEEEGSTPRAKNAGVARAAGACARPLLRAVVRSFGADARGDLRSCRTRRGPGGKHAERAISIRSRCSNVMFAMFAFAVRQYAAQASASITLRKKKNHGSCLCT